MDVGERPDVVSVLRPNHVEGSGPERVDFSGFPIGHLERAVEHQVPLPVVLVPEVALAALPDAHRMKGEAKTVLDGEVPLRRREASRFHDAPGLPNVLQSPGEHALPPGWNRARRRIGAVRVVGLVAYQRRIEHADDAQACVIPNDAVPVLRAYAVEHPGLESPTLASRAILERRAAGSHVVGFPVMLVPESGLPGLLRAGFRDAEAEAIGLRQKPDGSGFAVRDRDDPALGLELLHGSD